MWEWLQGLNGGAAAFVGSATGSAIGLVALLLGALFNFGLNRRRDALLRREEANAVAAALYGEVLLIQRELAKIGNRVVQVRMRYPPAEFDRQFLDENPIPEPTLYNALASKLGMLPPGEVLALTEFHAQLKELTHWLPQLQHDDTKKHSYSVLYVLEPIHDAITTIAPTLRSIEKRLSIESPAPEPDLSRTNEMIEMERLSFEEARQQYAV